MVADGMQIIDAGTFDKKEEKIFVEREKEKEQQRKEERIRNRKVVEEVVRVKAKKKE